MSVRTIASMLCRPRGRGGASWSLRATAPPPLVMPPAHAPVPPCSCRAPSGSSHGNTPATAPAKLSNGLSSTTTTEPSARSAKSSVLVTTSFSYNGRGALPSLQHSSESVFCEGGWYRRAACHLLRVETVMVALSCCRRLRFGVTKQYHRTTPFPKATFITRLSTFLCPPHCNGCQRFARLPQCCNLEHQLPRPSTRRCAGCRCRTCSVPPPRRGCHGCQGCRKVQRWLALPSVSGTSLQPAAFNLQRPQSSFVYVSP